MSWCGTGAQSRRGLAAASALGAEGEAAAGGDPATPGRLPGSSLNEGSLPKIRIHVASPNTPHALLNPARAAMGGRS